MTELVPQFTRAAKLLRGAADAAMRRHGVRVGQNLLLDQLRAQDGLAPGELARRLGVATPTIVKMATRMEAAGLLTRRRDTDDARLVRLHLTERGRTAHDAVEIERRNLQEQVTSAFTETERRHMQSALAKMIRELEALERTPEDEAD